MVERRKIRVKMSLTNLMEFKKEVLVVFDEDENGCPELKISIRPEDLGVCSCSLSGDHTDEAW